MKKMFICLVLVCLVLLTSCNSLPEDINNETTAPAETTAAELPVVLNNVVLNSASEKYTIIRPENADAVTKNAASTLWRYLYDRSSDVKIEINDDWVANESEKNNDSFEILVGSTNRPQSANALNNLTAYLDFLITVDGNKICINANTPERVEAAVECFISHIVSQDGKLIYNGDKNFIGKAEYSIPDIIISGAAIKDYVIVVPKNATEDENLVAESIKTFVAEKNGAMLNIVSDSESQAKNEILIGKTDRAESRAELTSGSRVSTVGTKLVINAASRTQLLSAKNILLDYLKHNSGAIAEGLELVNDGSPEDLFYNGNYGTGIVSDNVNPAVLALLGCCEYYCDSLQKGIKKGEKWVYSNSSTYVPQRGYFDDMLKTKKLGANCASPVNWAFMDMGIMPSTERFYGGSTGDFANYNKVKGYLEPACEIFDVTGEGKTFRQLFAEGRVKAGDIFLCVHHTFIYRGDKTFYAAGHDGKWHTDNEAKTEDSKKAVFDSWLNDMDNCVNTDYKIYYIVRLKDDYMPKYYRNSAGELVENMIK